MPAKTGFTLGYCPIGNGHTIHPFDELFTFKENVANGMLGMVDAVVFWGGTDIHPSYYNQKAHPASQVKGLSSPTSRDVFEWKMMLWCKMNEIPMIGVCRGAQLMCAFAGGQIIQHVNGHHQDHEVVTKDGKLFTTTSCHHQMMYPYDVDHELLAWASPALSNFYQGEEVKPISAMFDKREPEIVYFPTIQGLAIQGHPEWSAKGSEFNKYVLDMVKEKLLSKETVE